MATRWKGAIAVIATLLGGATAVSRPAAATADSSLQQVIDSWLASRDGAAYGIRIEEIGGDRTAEHNADTPFTMASTYKPFLVQAALTLVDTGELTLDRPMEIGGSVGGCITDLIVWSSNVCPDELTSLVGFARRDEIVHDEGFSSTSLADKLSTARDEVAFVRLLTAGELLSPASTNLLVGLMSQQVWRDGIPAGVGARVSIIDKPGWLDSVTNDMAVVTGDDSTYSLAIMSSISDNWVEIADLSSRIQAWFVAHPPAAQHVAWSAPTTQLLGPALGFEPLAPVRALDTRASRAPIAAGETRRVNVATAGVGAAALNLTVTATKGAGFLTAWQCGGARPLASSLNYGPAAARAAGVVVPLSPEGDVCVFSLAATDLVVDVTGQYRVAAPDRFAPMVPQRLWDSRNHHRLAADEVLHLDVPAATAAAINITTTATLIDGFVTAWPCNANPPVTSNVNTVAGATVANQAQVAVDGGLCLRASTPTDMIVDLTGTYSPSGGYRLQPALPLRLLDTRDGTGSWLGRLAPLQELRVATSAVAGQPAGAVAAIGTVTAVDARSDAFVTTWGCGPRPVASTLNPTAGDTVANGAIVMLTAGDTCLTANQPAHLLLDITGWFIP